MLFPSTLHEEAVVRPSCAEQQKQQSVLSLQSSPSVTQRTPDMMPLSLQPHCHVASSHLHLMNNPSRLATSWWVAWRFWHGWLTLPSFKSTRRRRFVLLTFSLSPWRNPLTDACCKTCKGRVDNMKWCHRKRAASESYRCKCCLGDNDYRSPASGFSFFFCCAQAFVPIFVLTLDLLVSHFKISWGNCEKNQGAWKWSHIVENGICSGWNDHSACSDSVDQPLYWAKALCLHQRSLTVHQQTKMSPKVYWLPWDLSQGGVHAILPLESGQTHWELGQKINVGISEKVSGVFKSGFLSCFKNPYLSCPNCCWQ